MKPYLQIIAAFALTAIIQAASAQSDPTATSAFAIVDAVDGNPLGTNATVFAGSRVNVRISFDLGNVTDTSSTNTANNYLSRMSPNLQLSYTPESGTLSASEEMDLFSFMLDMSQGLGLMNLYRPMGNIADAPDFFNGQLLSITQNDGTLGLVISNEPPALAAFPRGVWCPSPTGNSCRLDIIDITFPLPTTIPTGTLTITMEGTVFRGTQAFTLDSADVTFDVVEGYEFSITDNNDTNTADPDVDVAEGGTATFDVTLSPAMPAISNDITLPWSVTAGTATADDFGGTLPSGSLTFAANTDVTTQTISIPIPADMVAEGEEAFTLALGTPTPATTGGVNVTADTTAVTVTIAASDAATVAFDSAEGVAVVGQDDDYQISLQNGVSLPLGTTLSVPYTVTGTAATGEFTATASPIEITGAGPGVINIDVPEPANIADVVDDTIILTLGTPSFSIGGTGFTAPMLGTNSVLTLTIVQGFVVTVDDVTVAAEGGTADLMVSVTPTPEEPITVNLATGATGDSATAGEDYDAVTTTVSFGIGETSQMVSVPITNDVVTEGDESFTVTLSAPPDLMSPLSGVPVPVMADDTASVTISANDRLMVSLEPASIGVIDQPNTYTVSLGDSQLPATGAGRLTVPYTITGTAVEGTDYTDETVEGTTPTPGRVEIEAGTSAENILINILPGATEGRQFTIALGTPTLTGIAGALAPMPLPPAEGGSREIEIVRGFVISMVTPDPDPLEVGEGETAQFMAALMPASATAITVPWTVSGSGDNAAEDADFAGVTGSITFAPGETSAMIDVVVADNTQYEAERGFTVMLGTPTPATADFPMDGPTGLPVALGSPNNANGLISDDPLTVVLTGPADVREGQTETYTVSLNGDVGGIEDVLDADVTVDFTLTPVDADDPIGGPPIDAPVEGTDVEAGADYNPLAVSPLTISTSTGGTQATLEIVFFDDEVDDAEERLDLELGTIGGGGTADIMAGDPTLIEITILEVDVEQRTQAMENTLAVFGRSVAGDLVRMMEARTSSARSASQSGSQAIIGGKRLSADWLRSALSGKKAAATGGDTSTGGTTIADGDGNTVTGAPALVGSETTALGGGDFVTGAGGLATDGDTSAELSSIQPTVALVRDGLSMVGLNVGETGVSYHSVDLRRLLAGSSFQLALNGEGGQAGSWTVWGRGSITNFDGRPGNDFSVDGDMFSGQIGIDTHVNANMLAGLAVNYSEGDSDYDFTEGTRGNIETELTSVHPYVQWSGESGLDLWVMLGYGEGDATLEDESGAVETDLDMKMAAAGVRRDVDQLGYLDWALKADVFFMRLEADERVDLLNAVEADTWQLRLAVEGSKDLLLDGDASMKGVGEIGWRLDGGDAETGMGIEIGGGLDYANPNAGLTVTARGHYLLAHRDSDFDEWGASISASFDPGVVGRGLRLSLTPTLGAASGGADRLWEDNSLIESAVDNLDDSVTPDMTMGAEAAYGMAVMNDRGLFTPFSELSWSDQNSRTRLGARMELLMPSRMDIGFAFYGEQEYQAGAADGVSGVLESRVRRSFAHDMGVIDLFGKMQSGTSDDYQIGVETKLNF